MFSLCISALIWKRVKSHTKCLLEVREPRVTITWRSLIYFWQLLFLFIYFFPPRSMRFCHEGSVLLELEAIDQHHLIFFATSAFLHFLLNTPAPCLEITRPIMRKNPILVTAGSMRHARGPQ